MVNDVTILGGIILVFVLIGVTTPLINDEFGSSNPEHNVDGLIEDGVEPTVLNASTFVGSVFGMFFWTFGALPFWLDGILVCIRLVFWFIVARNIWVGGGA